MTNTNQLTDEQLWALVRADEETAFRRLFDRFYTYLLVTVTNVTGNRELAQEVAQDVFFQLWSKRKELEINSAFKPYIRRAALNKAFNVLKYNSKFNAEEDIPEYNKREEDSPQNQLETKGLQQIIDEAIHALPERCRMVFTLCRLEGLSHKEIAEQMGTSTKTVEHQMTKALSILKDAIRPYLSWAPLLFSLNLF